MDHYYSGYLEAFGFLKIYSGLFLNILFNSQYFKKKENFEKLRKIQKLKKSFEKLKRSEEPSNVLLGNVFCDILIIFIISMKMKSY